MQRLFWVSGWLGLALAQTAPSAAPTYGSGVATECVKQSDNPCPRPYFYDFTPVGNFAFFSCGSDGYARCGYNPVTATIVPGSCSLQSSPCGMEARAAPTYDFSSALSKYAYFSCDIDYYRCAYDVNYGTMSNCVKRVSPCPFSVEAFYAIGNAGFFACSADGYYQCVYDASTGVVDLGTCVQKPAPCSVTHDLSVTAPYAYFSCGEGGVYKCGFDSTSSTISTSCTRANSPCGGIVKRTYSFITQANWAFYDCYNDGYYKCKYNSPPTWTTTGSCVVTANCVTSGNYPADYSPLETCIITPLFPQIVHFDDFFTENGYDILVVNNVSYQGRNKPPDQNVSTPIRWNSDASIVQSGWKFCGTSPNAPSTPSPSVRVTPFPTPVGSSSTSAAPTAGSLFPSVAPSSLPTVMPSLAPSSEPSLAPSSMPSLAPSVAPSLAPSAAPSLAPSAAPSFAPSTAKPTPLPTVVPTSAPTPAPTSAPSLTPSASPVTKVPTTRAPTPVPGDTAGTVISALLIVGLCGLLAFFGLLWWRRSRRAAVSVAPDDAPPPSPRIRVREVVSDKPLYGPPESREDRPATRDDRRESGTSIEML